MILGNSLLTGPSAWLIYTLGLGALLIGVGSWAFGWWSAQRGHRETDALNAVMTATVHRHSLEESMGLLLDYAVEHLHASSGSLHLADDATGDLRLVYAAGIERFDLLARLPLNDPLVARLLAVSEEVLIEPLEFESPWAALSLGTRLTLVAMRLGGRSRRQGLMVLAWRTRREAASHSSSVLSIGRYARQMLSEFDELARRASDFQALNTALQRLEALTRTAAHDLGNKLTGFYGGLYALSAAERAPEFQPQVEELLRQLDVVNTMLEDFKDPDRSLEVERVSVEEVIELSAGLMARQLNDTFFEFTVDVPAGLPDVWGERIAILRILDNLLSNAIKHNLEKPNLHIWLCARLSGNEILFEVGDSGVGIPLEAQPQLFEFGFRVEAGGRVKGYGMGLWSCRRLVEAHGGRIWAESQVGWGTRFFFTLPAKLQDFSSESVDAIQP